MRLKVLRMGGSSYELEVPDTATCEELKRQLAGVSGLAAARQRLIFRGRVLRDAERLSDAGVGDGHTLHLVDMPPGAAPGPPPPPAAGAGAADGPGLVPDMFGGMFGGLGGVPGAAPGVQGTATIMGPFMVDAGAAGGDLGAQIMAALGGAAGPAPGVPAATAPQGPPTANLPMPTPPVLRMRGGPYQHLLTGLNLMMARMEAEADDPDLDALPRIREHYGRPSSAEIMHFLRAARTLLNSAPLTVATRGGVNRVLTAAGLPALRPRPWERDGGGHETSSAEGEEDSYWETDEDEEGGGGEGAEQHGSRGERPRQRRRTDGAGGAGAPQRLGSSQQLQSFPVSAENSEDEGERAQQAQREAPPRGRAAPAAAGGRDAPAAVAADDDLPPLEYATSDGNEDVPPGVESDRSGEDDDDDEDYTDEEEAGDPTEGVSNEDLILVAAVCLGELTSRFLDFAGTESDDLLWDLADELRALTSVRQSDMQRLAVDVQQLTARTYRVGAVWAELSRGLQYLGASLERGNMAIVSAIPGFLSVMGSQAVPNLQRPGYPPDAYLPPTNGIFAGQIPDAYGSGWVGGGAGGMPAQSAVVDIQVQGAHPAGPAGAPAAGGGVGAATAGGEQQPAHGQAAPAAAGQPAGAAAAAGGQLPAAVNGGQPVNFNQLLSGILGGVLGMPVAAGAPVAAAQPAAGAAGQPAPQGVGVRPAAAAQPGGAQQAMRQVDSLVASMRASVDQAAQRVHDARNAMQAVITGGEGGPQMVLQRAHHTMQALVAAEEAMNRARQRAEQAQQYAQRVLRSQQAQQAPGQQRVMHQAVRITVGGPGGVPVQVTGVPAAAAAAPGAAGQPAAGQQQQQQQQQRSVAIPLFTMGHQGAQPGPGAPGAATAAAAAATAAAAARPATQQQLAQQQAQQAGAAPSSQAAGGELPIMQYVQQLLAGLGMSPAARQDLLQQFMGVTQALRQTSIASLDLPALLAEIRTALSTALAETAQQARSAQGAAPGGDAAAAGVEWAALTQAAVPRMVAAVREVLERHLARVRSAPALREFLPHLHEMGIDLQPQQRTEPAGGASSTEPAAAPAAPPSQAPTPAAAAAAAEAAPAPAQAAAPALAAAGAAAAAQAAQEQPGAAPAAATFPAVPSAAPAAETPVPAGAAGVQPAAEQRPEEAPSTSAPASAPPAAKAPAGLGLGKGLGRPAVKKRQPARPAAAASAADVGSSALQAMAAAGREQAAAGAAGSSAAAEGSAPKQQHQHQQEQEVAARAAGAGEEAPAAPSPAGSSQELERKRGEATAEAAAAEAGPAAESESGLEIIPPRPAAPRGPGAAAGAGPDLGALMSGLLGGGGGAPAGGAGGGGGGGGGGLMGLMNSMMQSPTFMQVAQSPAMQQMAERMLGGGAGGGGGGLDLSFMGDLMGEMLGGGAGGAGASRQGPRARGMDALLGGGGGAGRPAEAPADLDAALSVLPPEEAARWKETLEADAERQAHMAAPGGEGPAGGAGFSDAYSALRMAGRSRSAGSGLLGMLGGAGAEEGEGEE